MSGSQSNSRSSSKKGEQNQTGTEEYRKWVKSMEAIVAEKQKNWGNIPALTLYLTTINDLLNEYDKAFIKCEALVADQIKVDESFDNGWKTLFSAIGSTAISLVSYFYNDNKGAALSSVVGTLVPILVSSFIIGKAWKAEYDIEAEQKIHAETKRSLSYYLQVETAELANLLTYLNSVGDVKLTTEQLNDFFLSTDKDGNIKLKNKLFHTEPMEEGKGEDEQDSRGSINSSNNNFYSSTKHISTQASRPTQHSPATINAVSTDATPLLGHGPKNDHHDS